ncbi:hypothetical protein [Egbenema bharatensis]|uniref:hypothetical protein n=1 Tax=Egbenema bharatensis TaxID=3463334 RepID=UPI003A89524C
MNFSRIISNAIRAVLVVFICTLLVVSNAFPAAAIGSSQSNPTEGDTRLDEIFRKSEEVTKADPLSMEETQRRANEGLNEVQGAADVNQMYRPEDAPQATTGKDQLQNVLERATGKK